MKKLIILAVSALLAIPAFADMNAGTPSSDMNNQNAGISGDTPADPSHSMSGTAANETPTTTGATTSEQGTTQNTESTTTAKRHKRHSAKGKMDHSKMESGASTAPSTATPNNP